jgi:hypothetical protein
VRILHACFSRITSLKVMRARYEIFEWCGYIDPAFGCGLSLAMRDVRVLRDHLLTNLIRMLRRRRMRQSTMLITLHCTALMAGGETSSMAWVRNWKPCVLARYRRSHEILHGCPTSSVWGPMPLTIKGATRFFAED